MLFNSNFFIYIFLPSLLLTSYGLYQLSKRNIKVVNFVLLLFSVLFYICTGGSAFIILFAVVLINYVFGLLISCTHARIKKLLLFVTVLSNLLILGYYKYFSFLYRNICSLLSREMNELVLNIILPVGISFYIFQATSYAIDVYRGDVKVQKNFLSFMLYLVFFPQLIAGPIVRYQTIADEIDGRTIQTDDLFAGLFRFVIGLSKKVLIADCLAKSVDMIWELSSGDLTIGLSWGGAVLYTLQIYFDFSGYSDMAIGLGRIFGFHFQENFNQPYTATSITDFWRRWHISLSSFLKDYLYIPLGGNRKGIVITYRNLLVVFIVCGIWHGAGWNFLVWGLYHGIFQLIERQVRNSGHKEKYFLIGRVTTFLIVCLGWVLFRASDLSQAFMYYKAMLGLNDQNPWLYYSFSYYINLKTFIIAFFGLVVSFFNLDKARKFFSNNTVKCITMIVLLVLCMAYMSDATFTPFIYFQF